MATQIQKFHRSNLDNIADDAMTALQAVADKYDIDIQKGRGTYSDTNYTLKIEMSVKDKTGQVITREARDFKSFADAYGLQSDDLGKTFPASGRTFEIVGLSTKAKKYPILAKDVNTGGTYKFPATRVATALAKGA